jgi:hypothetical protein
MPGTMKHAVFGTVAELSSKFFLGADAKFRRQN